MGFLKTITGVPSGTVRLDRDCHTLLVVRHSANTIGAQLRKICPELVSASIRNHAGALEDVIKRATLGDLVAYSQYGNAPVQEFIATDSTSLQYLKDQLSFGFAETEIAVNRYVALLPIALTADGKCVSIGSDDDFVFQLDGLDTAAVYDFFALEGDSTGTNMLRYENVNILQDQHERDMDVDQMAALVIPGWVALNRLLFTYGNGRVSKFTVRELKFLSTQHNPVETISTTLSNAGALSTVIQHGPMTSQILVMPLHQITSLELDTDGTPLQFLAVYNRSRLVKAI